MAKDLEIITSRRNKITVEYRYVYFNGILAKALSTKGAAIRYAKRLASADEQGRVNQTFGTIANPSTPKNKWIKVKAIKFLGGGKIQVMK